MGHHARSGRGTTLHTASDGCRARRRRRRWMCGCGVSSRRGAGRRSVRRTRRRGTPARPQARGVGSWRAHGVATAQAGGSANPTDPTYLESRDSARRSARHGGSGGGDRGAEGVHTRPPAAVTPHCTPPADPPRVQLGLSVQVTFFLHVLSCSVLTLVVGSCPFLGLWCYSRVPLLDTRGCPRGASSVSVVSNSWVVVLKKGATFGHARASTWCLVGLGRVQFFGRGA